MDKYLHYKATDLAQEPSFIQWVKKPASNQKEDWAQWLTNHPNMTEVVNEARLMVQTIVFDQKDIDQEAEDRLWENIDSNTHTINRSRRGIIRLISYGAAAAVVLLLMFTMLTSPYDTTVSTSYAQTKTITLPDGSSVALNADSELEYDSDSWDKNRLLTLKGEGFFKVEKGSSFKVKTALGDVTVLGTSFNVFAREEDLFVQCETGKVSVKNRNEETILVANESVEIHNGIHSAKIVISDQGKRSQWQSGLFSFSNIELRQVVLELERQLDLNIKVDKKALSLSYTGSFNIANGEDALSEVFWPLNLTFTKEGRTVIVNQQ